MELRRVRQTSLTYSKERGSRVRVYRRVCARLTRLADKSLHVSKSWHFEQVESKGNRFRTLAKAAGRAGTGSPRGTARPRVPALSRADLAIQNLMSLGTSSHDAFPSRDGKFLQARRRNGLIACNL